MFCRGLGCTGDRFATFDPLIQEKRSGSRLAMVLQKQFQTLLVLVAALASGWACTSSVPNAGEYAPGEESASAAGGSSASDASSGTSSGAASSTAAGENTDAGADVATSSTTSSALPDPTAPLFTCDDSTHDPGPAPLRRLTATQYQNAVQDVFGEVDLSTTFAANGETSRFGLVQPDVSQTELEIYAQAASSVATFVGERLDEFAACETTDAIEAAADCANDYLASVGPRVFRSPLTDADSERLLQVFEVGYTTDGYAKGIELMTESLLSSPRFLYRPELGAAETKDGTLRLSSHEIAARLSFAFWNTTPDAELYQAAESGELDDDAGVAAAAARLIESPRAEQQFVEFFGSWLGSSELVYTTKDPTAYPSYDADLSRAMADQAEAFFRHVLFEAGGDFRRLFDARLSDFAPASLTSYYESTLPSELGADRGMLALPGLLTVHSKPNESFPIYRGLFVRERILCSELPSPPPAVGDPPAPEPGVSTRERFEQHSASAVCNDCHKLIDPLGFALENFDAVGRFRTEDNGFEIDPSGELTDTYDADGPFANVGELSDRLASSQQVQACVARQWFRYVMQRFEQPADDCSMQDLFAAFTEADLDLNSLPKAIVSTPAFLERRAF